MYAERLSRLHARMADTNTDLVAIGPSSHLAYLTGLHPHGDERPVMLIASKHYAGMLMPALNADSQRGLTELPFITWTDAEGPQGALNQLLEKAGATRSGLSVALDETMRADFALLVLDALEGAKHKFTGDTVGALRARKDEGEYRLLKENALLNDQAMQAAFAALKSGVTEIEIEAVVRDFYRQNGARPEFTAICFGENGAFPHHTSSSRALRESEVVLIDIGGRKDGYPSDMTRVGFVGEKPGEFDKVHDVLERAVQAALKAVKPGVKAREVDKAARDVITEAGYGPNFLHRTGHGVGIDIHEPPYITATSEVVLEEGNVFSIEPGIYLAGKFGIRLEEIVIVRKDGAEILSDLPRTAIRGG